MKRDKVLSKLSSYIDSELPAGERLLVEGHMRDCSDCREEMNILLKNRSLLKQLPIVDPSNSFHEKLIERLRAEKRSVVRQSSLPEIFARWWVPVPVLCSALIVIFIGFTVLSPLVYATAGKAQDAGELSKSAFLAVSAKNIFGPANYVRFCNKCHSTLCVCENCKKGLQCECK